MSQNRLFMTVAVIEGDAAFDPRSERPMSTPTMVTP